MSVAGIIVVGMTMSLLLTGSGWFFQWLVVVNSRGPNRLFYPAVAAYSVWFLSNLTKHVASPSPLTIKFPRRDYVFFSRSSVVRNHFSIVIDHDFINHDRNGSISLCLCGVSHMEIWSSDLLRQFVRRQNIELLFCSQILSDSLKLFHGGCLFLWRCNGYSRIGLA